jgi:hypothetical protein
MAGERGRASRVTAVVVRLAVAGAAAVFCVAGCADGDAAGPDVATTTSAPDPDPEPDPASSGASCVETFSLGGLTGRAFAFDGTVVEVTRELDPKLEDDGSGDQEQRRARFAVAEWFSGGTGDSVVVWLQRDVVVGDRLLVSGEPRWGGAPLDDAIQWECGWTVEHSTSEADAWRGATAAR